MRTSISAVSVLTTLADSPSITFQFKGKPLNPVLFFNTQILKRCSAWVTSCFVHAVYWKCWHCDAADLASSPKSTL